MNPKAYHTLFPCEVSFNWPGGYDYGESFTAVRGWLNLLHWGTVSGRTPIPYGNSLR